MALSTTKKLHKTVPSFDLTGIKLETNRINIIVEASVEECISVYTKTAYDSNEHEIVVGERDGVAIVKCKSTGSGASMNVGGISVGSVVMAGGSTCSFNGVTFRGNCVSVRGGIPYVDGVPHDPKTGKPMGKGGASKSSDSELPMPDVYVAIPRAYTVRVTTTSQGKVNIRAPVKDVYATTNSQSECSIDRCESVTATLNSQSTLVCDSMTGSLDCTSNSQTTGRFTGSFTSVVVTGNSQSTTTTTGDCSGSYTANGNSQSTIRHRGAIRGRVVKTVRSQATVDLGKGTGAGGGGEKKRSGSSSDSGTEGSRRKRHKKKKSSSTSYSHAYAAPPPPRQTPAPAAPPPKTPEQLAFEMLGLLPTDDMDEITAMYRKKAMKLHPDRPGGDTEKFKKLQNAYTLLAEKHGRGYE